MKFILTLSKIQMEPLKLSYSRKRINCEVSSVNKKYFSILKPTSLSRKKKNRGEKVFIHFFYDDFAHEKK